MSTPSNGRRLRKRTVAYIAAGLLVPGTAVAVTLMPASAAAGPTAGFTKDSDWGSGWQGKVVIANGGTSAINGWKVEFDLPAGTTIGSYWDALLTTSGSHLTFTNRDWNGTIAPGASVTFGLLGSGSGSPTGCKLNGAPCTGGAQPTSQPTTTRPPVTTTPPVKPTTVAPTASKPPTTTKPPTATVAPPPSTGANLDDPRKKDIAMQIVSTAENSSTNWRAQFGYIEDIKDGRGYTAGIIGFCSGTSDMLALVQEYSRRKPGNVLEKYLPALRSVNGSASHAGLDPTYVNDWRTAATDPVFQQAQEDERDRQYFNPSVALGKSDGVRALGQFAYYDAAVVHGFSGMKSVRNVALQSAKPPAQGGNEADWLNAFMNARVLEMKKEAAHDDVSRIEKAQRRFLGEKNFDLNTPLNFEVYGDKFTIN
jgi:chitosanase